MSWRSTRERPRPARSCSMSWRGLSPSAQRELKQHYPRPGWVEHDPEDIWRDTLAVAREAACAERGRRRAGSRASGSPTSARQRWSGTARPASRSTARSCGRTGAPPSRCAELKADGAEPLVRARTGLLLDPYFSATKIAWMLDNVPGARERAERGELAFGTIDSFLLWRLTGGAVHATDVTNASRTLLFDIHAAALGCRAVPAVRRARGAASRGARQQPHLRNDRVWDVRRPNPDRRNGGRPAGGAVRPGLFRARHGQVDLRHRLFHAAQHGRGGGRITATGC